MKIVFGLLAVLALSAGLKADAPVPNPQYVHWAKFNPGSRNISKGQLIAGEQKLVITATTVLKEVRPDQLTLEITTQVSAATGHSPPATTKIEAVKAQSAPELDEASVQIKKLQPERVEALGKTILCDVYQLQVRQIEGDAQIKMWTNSQVPGTVKTQISVKSAAMNLSRELVVDQVEAK